MNEFGFYAVELDQPGAPTPGRIADRLFDIVGELEKDPAGGLATLRRLLRALDEYDRAMLMGAAR